MPKYIEWDSLDQKLEECLDAADYGFDNDLLNQVLDVLSDPPAADVEPVRHGRWIPVTDDSLPDEGEEVLVYDGCYRVGKIKKGISVNDRERMKRGEIPDPEEWGWNVAEGYFRVRRSEAYKACDEQGNNERPYCWQVDNGKGTLFGQDVKYWMPLFKLQKEKTVNEITPEMIEAMERNEKRIKEKADQIFDEMVSEKQAEIERLKARIAKMPPLDYEKLAANPPEPPKEADTWLIP